MRFTNYQFKKLIRSYTFIPPYIVYMIWIAMLYVYSGQSILSSYASSTIVLLSVSAWLTINIYQLENNKERQLLFIQFNSKLNYLTHKINTFNHFFNTLSNHFQSLFRKSVYRTYDSCNTYTCDCCHLRSINRYLYLYSKRHVEKV